MLDTTFRTALRRLDAAGRLAKVRRPLSVTDEIAAVMRRYDGDLAFLFEAQGHSIPVVGNVLASPSNCEIALEADTATLRERMLCAIAERLPPIVVDHGPSQEVVRAGELDLGALLPVLRHGPRDVGRFITAGAVIVRDPVTGVHNVSFHRMQLLGGARTAIRLDQGRHLRAAYERSRELGRPLAIAVCIGPDTALLFAAALSGSQMPEAADELAAAGALRGAPLPMLRCVSQDVIAPAETEIVLEGTILPTETVDEGPFGEFVGYLSDAGPSPVFKVTALTHRREPLYHAICGTGRESSMFRKYALEAGALRVLRRAVPIVRDVCLTAGGLRRFHMVVQVEKRRPEHEGLQRNAIMAAFSVYKEIDLVVAVDDDIDITDPVDVEYALATRMEASRDLIVVAGGRTHEYIRVSDNGLRAKLGIDATVPFADRERFERVSFVEAPVTWPDIDLTPEPDRWAATQA